jgi:hypothetical protein
MCQYPALIRTTITANSITRHFALAIASVNAVALIAFVLAQRAAAAGIIAFQDWLNIERDGGALEVVNYFQTGLAAAFLITTGLLSRRPLYLALGLLFVFILLDDSLQYHESVGRMLVAGLHLPAAPGLRRQDTGELLAWAIAGAVLLPLLAYAHWRSPPVVQRHSIALLLFFILLVICAVILDMLHMLLSATSLSGEIVFLEDGGEMVAMAGACAFAFGLMLRHARRRPAIRGILDRYPLSQPSA